MIEIIGTELYQWDTGRSVRVESTGATHVHLANQGDSQAPIIELKDGQAIELGRVDEGFADYKPAGGSSVAHNALHPEAFVDLEVSDNNVYTLYSGRTFAEYKLAVYEGESIRVYDWHGNLKKEYRLDVPVLNICVDEEGKRIYAFANIPDPTLVYFDLPE